MFVYPKRYGVIVVGGGHAGVEAALASARMGCETLLLTINLDTIAQMSCNPAIGGLAKGHLVREIDALGGEMGIATDMSGIQFRMLNTKKGPSVWAPRAQCDKKAYQLRLKWVCEKQTNLDCKQAQSVKVLHHNGTAFGIETALETQFHAQCIVITTGTFLRAIMHTGTCQQSGGRAGESASLSLSNSLNEIGIQLGRLKTGTPPRLVKKSIDFSKTRVQKGDTTIPYFSYWKDDLFHVEQSKMHSEAPNYDHDNYPPGSMLSINNGQIDCYITSTTYETKRIVQDNLYKSPVYSGTINGIGPRYCPSIEDKIVKFPGKDIHQIFLEPEGISTDEIYINGLSTSMPYDVQIPLVRSIIGCEHAEIIRPAYAVEYDFANPTQLFGTLETKLCQNLFLAGQINGTSGYEEAAAQGIIAGINAGRLASGKQPITLRRDQAYIGVLIDDLITKGTAEPYRMFTSRAEYRLLLRQDNADTRLCKIGYDTGLIPSKNFDRFTDKQNAIREEIHRLQSTRCGNQSLCQILKRPEIHYSDLTQQNQSLSREVINQVEIEIKYAGYIARQEIEVAHLKHIETKSIPDWFDFQTIPSLRSEARLKLTEIRPSTLGQASRISGVTPADISILSVFLQRGPQ